MKLKTVLFANLLCLPAIAQRDYQLVENRNVWLTSGNAAALTTFADSTIAAADVSYQYDGGSLRTRSQGKHQNTYGAGARSYCRLSESAVAHGSIAYGNKYGTQMAGSMLMPRAELMPFDIIEESEETAGSKQCETFNIAGAIGWNTASGMAIGAKADFLAGNYAKHRDLRHSNTMMNLNTSVCILYRPWGIGAGFTYRRNTETVRFKTYGTTDAVYKTLIDYANRHGKVETFGGDGFTDDTQEMPLFSEYTGTEAQWQRHGLFIGATWQHRTGYYGKQSQYTVSQSQHTGDVFTAHMRYDLTDNGRHLWWVDMTLNTEQLTAKRANYRHITASDNATLRYYEYYEPTKMSDKAHTDITITFNGYRKPAGDIFLWHINGGLYCRHDKQTAYLYPETYTAKTRSLTPFVTMRRGLLSGNTALLSAQAGYAMTFGSVEQLAAHARIAYEIPLGKTAVRPSLALRYDYAAGTGGTIKGLSRHSVAIMVEATF